jgi:hypothetical protein
MAILSVFLSCITFISENMTLKENIIITLKQRKYNKEDTSNSEEKKYKTP